MTGSRVEPLQEILSIVGLPVGSAKNLDTAKAEFKAAWEAFKQRVGPEALARAYEVMKR